ncbi:MAG: hypothetical protein Q8S19_02330 [Bacillota bacterium]|nr:hypothetical protein [Bacillota bacterium]
MSTERTVPVVPEEDDADYLETKEDAEQNQQIRAAHAVERFCQENGVTDARQIHSSPVLFREICEILVNEVALTLRKTAEHLATTHQRVHEALQD